LGYTFDTPEFGWIEAVRVHEIGSRIGCGFGVRIDAANGTLAAISSVAL